MLYVIRGVSDSSTEWRDLDFFLLPVVYAVSEFPPLRPWTARFDRVMRDFALVLMALFLVIWLLSHDLAPWL
ncbi:MAG TPA: hypothetical protein PK765_00875 [bacterium]|nr:hypothetical protein [bacterium]